MEIQGTRYGVILVNTEGSNKSCLPILVFKKVVLNDFLEEVLTKVNGEG